MSGRTGNSGIGTLRLPDLWPSRRAPPGFRDSLGMTSKHSRARLLKACAGFVEWRVTVLWCSPTHPAAISALPLGQLSRSGASPSVSHHDFAGSPSLLDNFENGHLSEAVVFVFGSVKHS